jgi:hypothetical protein
MRKQLSRGILVLLPKLIFNLFRRSLHRLLSALIHRRDEEKRQSAKMDKMKNEGNCYDFKLQRCHFLEQKVAFSMSSDVVSEIIRIHIVYHFSCVTLSHQKFFNLDSIVKKVRPEHFYG